MSQIVPASPQSAWKGRLPAIVFVVVAAIFYLRTTAYIPPRHIALGSLPLQALDGRPLPPHAFAGRPVLLNFWAPWCGPCRAELPWLQRLQTQHPELTVIGLEDDPDEFQNASAVAAEAGISYPMLRTSGPLRAALGRVVELPTTLYISRSGKVIHTVSGVIPEEMIERYAMEAVAAQ